MKYYIHDTTIGQFIYFNTLNELVGYYDHFIPRAYNVTKPQFMQHLIDLGHGYDDGQGVMLTRAISENYNIGVVRSNNQKERTDVFEATKFLSKEYGD
jgi:hypothetical protein